MQSAGKRPGGAIAASETAVVLLLPNDIRGGGNFHSGWLDYFKNRASKEDKDVALYFSFLETGRKYVAPLPDRSAIITANTRPPIPAGPDDVPPAVAAVVPTNALVNHLEQDAFVRRQKVMDCMNSSGTRAWNLFKESISHESWTLIEADERYGPADTSPIKDAFALYEIIRSTHAEAAVGGIRMSSQERQRIKDEFNLFQQGKLELGDFHKQFLQWMLKRVAAGIPVMDEAEQVSTFFGKLNSRIYGDLLRDRENNERKLILAGQPVPAITLAQALSTVRGYVPPLGATKYDATDKKLSVFTFDSKPDAAEMQLACEVLASAIPGASSQSVLLALRNANFGAGASGGGGGGKSKDVTTKNSDCAPLMVGGRPWTKDCSVPGCKLKHPFFLHQALTGQPPDEQSQVKIDAFAARKAQQGKKKGDAKGGRVLVAKDKDSDDDDVNHYFVGVAMADEDDEEDDCYTTSKYSVFVSDVSTPTCTWTDAVPQFTCAVVAIVVGYMSVWSIAVFLGHLVWTEQLRVLCLLSRFATQKYHRSTTNICCTTTRQVYRL